MMNPSMFLAEVEEKLIPELISKLETDPKKRDGRVIFAGPSRCNLGGIDINIEDKNGSVSTYWIDPMTQSFSAVKSR
jgi:hypothetical protein